MCKGPSRIGCSGSEVSGNFPRVKLEKRAGFLVLFVLVSHVDFDGLDHAANLSSCTARNPDRGLVQGAYNGTALWHRFDAMVVPVVEKRKIFCIRFAIILHPLPPLYCRVFSFYIPTCVCERLSLTENETAVDCASVCVRGWKTVFLLLRDLVFQ